MDQKGLFDEEEGKSTGDEFEGFEEMPKPPKKSNKNLLIGVGLLLIIGALAANFFLLKEEEPAVPPAPVRIPIKEAPVMENRTGVKAAAAKDEVKEKLVDKGMVEVKAAKPEAKKTEIKTEIKTEARKDEVKPVAGKLAEAKVAMKEDGKEKVKPEVKPEAMGKGEGVAVIIGTYVVRYELDTAQEKLKGIHHTVKETKKKLVMNRVLAKEVKDKDEARGVVSDLKEKGYDPFVLRINEVYKVYAVSNLNETISNANKADLEKLGYAPVIEKKEVRVKVYQLIGRAKDEKEAKRLSERLEKLGFKPEMNK